MPPDVMRPVVEMALMNSTKALFLLLASLLAWLFQTGHHEPGRDAGSAVAASTVVEAPAAAAARAPSPPVVSPLPPAGTPSRSAPVSSAPAAAPAAQPAGSPAGATDANPGDAPIRHKSRREDRQRPAGKPHLAATIRSDQAWSVGHATPSRQGSPD